MGDSIKSIRFSKSGNIDIVFEEGPEFDRMCELAQEVLAECRKSIMLAMRFLNMALWHMPTEPKPMIRTLATDGSKVYFDPERVVDRYSENPQEMIRDYLHLILHCVFHHPFDRKHDDRAAWSLACDISLELTITEACGSRFPSYLDPKRLAVGEKLAEEAGSLTAPALYKVLEASEAGIDSYTVGGYTASDIGEFTALFARDAHDLWANGEEEPRGESRGNSEAVPDVERLDTLDATGEGGGSAGGDSQEDEQPGAQTPADADTDDAEGSDDPGESGSAGGEESEDNEAAADEGADTEASDEDSAPRGGGAGRQEREVPDDQMDQAQKEWEDISKSVETDLQTFSQGAHAGNSSMLLNLRVANRKPANYEEFLRRFTTMGEDIRLNDDEFDYIFYTYGLSKYGNMPLVEPLEYKESDRVREFVIALDTSGSCSGDLIKAFVARTYDIMRQTNSFGDEVNVHIIQCDVNIKSDTKIGSMEELEKFRDSFRVCGMGGTDFRPVFTYVNEMIEAREFENLKGMIYFTDGMGTFPPKAPDYEVAFVFVEEEGAPVVVPPWAMKVVMTEDEVREVGHGLR